MKKLKQTAEKGKSKQVLLISCKQDKQEQEKQGIKEISSKQLAFQGISTSSEKRNV
jgi:hypothetical protein